MIGAALGLGFIFGPPVGGVVRFYLGIEWVGYVAAGLAALNLVLALIRLPESLEKTHAGRPIRFVDPAALAAVGRSPQLSRLFVVYFLFTLAFAILTVTGALLWRDRFALNDAQIGYTFAGIGVITAVVQLGLLGKLVARFGERSLMLTGLALMAVGLAPMPFVPESAFLTGEVALHFSLCGRLRAGVADSGTALVSRALTPAEQGQMLGQYQSTAALARILGPILGCSPVRLADRDDLPHWRGHHGCSHCCWPRAFSNPARLRSCQRTNQQRLNPMTTTLPSPVPPVAEIRGAAKEYKSGDTVIQALKPSSLALYPNELVLLIGPSGSGKTTLLSLLGCVIYPTKGDVLIAGQSTVRLKENRLAALRLEHIGFVFQGYNLIAPLNALQNVMLPLQLLGHNRNEARQKAVEALEKVQMSNRLGNLPKALSGGQQQRVAIARALVTDPSLILCDEPTAALDPASVGIVMAELQALARQGKCVTIVTHDMRLRPFADRIIYVNNGEISTLPPEDDALH